MSQSDRQPNPLGMPYHQHRSMVPRAEAVRQQPSGTPRLAQPRLAKRGSLVLRLLLGTVVALAFGRLHELIPGLGSLPIGKILIPLGFVALLLEPGLARRFQVLRTTQAKMFALLFFGMVVSIPFSLYKSGSLQQLIDFLRGTASLVVLVALACANESDLYTITRAMALAGGGLGLAVLAGAGAVVGGRAAAGTTYDPNDMALVGVVSFPLALWMLSDRSRLWRILGIASAAGSLATVVLSASRGGMLGLGVVLVLVAIQYRRRLTWTARLVGIAVLAAGLAAAPSTFWERMRSLEDPNADYNVTAETGRIALWKRGLGYYFTRPLTGVGLGQFGTAEGAWAVSNLGTTEGFKWSVAHSIWIEVLAEVGTFGIIGFLGLYLPTFRDMRRIQRSNSRLRQRSPPSNRLMGYGSALAISIVGFLVSGTFLANAYSPPAMMLAALGMAFSFAARQSGLVASRPRAASGSGRADVAKR